MNLEILKDIVKVAKSEGVAELKVEGKDYKVSVSFLTSAAPVHHVSATPVVQHHSPSQEVSHPSHTVTKNHSADLGLHVIKSPFVGTFYTSPSPGKPLYAKLGDKVKKGQTLCVLEAMKIMNEIDTDVAGEVVEICVENESLVEFGQPLFKIKPN